MGVEFVNLSSINSYFEKFCRALIKALTLMEEDLNGSWPELMKTLIEHKINGL